VVIVVALVLAGLCQLFDWGFFWLFQQLRVLQVDGG
jgi:preprotein translocase subunit SecE